METETSKLEFLNIAIHALFVLSIVFIPFSAYFKLNIYFILFLIFFGLSFFISLALKLYLFLNKIKIKDETVLNFIIVLGVLYLTFTIFISIKAHKHIKAHEKQSTNYNIKVKNAYIY